MTVKKSFEGQTIRALEIQGESVFDMMNNLLYVTSKALNVKENINEFQAFDIINTLIEDYKDVKMDEFIYIFKQGKKGIYGPHYNKFDIETIVHWINSYFKSDEYNNFIETRHKQHHDKVELTQQQKDWWAKINATVKEIDEKTKKRTFDGNIKMWCLTAKPEELNAMLADFTSAKYQEGIDIITNEIHRRGQNPAANS